jgi:hypothetical protein
MGDLSTINKLFLHSTHGDYKLSAAIYARLVSRRQMLQQNDPRTSHVDVCAIHTATTPVPTFLPNSGLQLMPPSLIYCG